MNSDLRIGEHDLLSLVRPDTLIGALVYLVIFVLFASILTRVWRAAVHASMTRAGHIDRTTINFLQQALTALIWVATLILYAHLIPVLNSMGTALLAGAGVASVVIGLAAQSTLGNLIAGFSITLYRPFRLGDTVQVAAPTGTEIGVVEGISLGYTTLRSPAGHLIVVPNSVAASQVILNLNSDALFIPWPLVVTVRMGRGADLEGARALALAAAQDLAGEQALIGCFLTRVEAGAATLELRLRASDAMHRDVLRSKLLAELARRFAAAQPAVTGAEAPSLS